MQQDETTIIENNDADERLMLLYGNIFQQLLRNEKFNVFFELNYRIEKTLNEEDKTMEVRVIQRDDMEVQQSLAKKVSDLVKERDKVTLAKPEDLRKLNASKNRTGYKV